MKKLLLFLLIVGFSLLWNCEEKKPVSVTAFSPPLPTTKPVIFREELKMNGSFLPGYISGKIRSDQVTLTWQQSTDPDFQAYQVFRDGNRLATITSPSDNSYTDSNLLQDHFYLYKIVVLNNSGQFLSDTIRIKTPRFLPPSNLNSQVLALDARILKIFWKNNAESATQFRVFRKIPGGFSFEFIGSTTDTFFVDDNNITPTEVFEYRVRAGNDFEETDPSIPLSVTAVYDMTPPTLNSVTQEINTRLVHISWTDNSTAEDGFRIWRRLNSASSFTLIGTVPTNATQFTDTDTLNLLVDSTYVYALTAFNTFEETPQSNTVSINIHQPIPFVEYNEGFETPLGNEWSFFSSDTLGRIERSTLDAHSGQFMLLMDVSSIVSINTNEAVLTIDLSGIPAFQDVFLRFYFNTYADEINPFEDKVEVSTDGQTWTNVFSYFPSAFLWSFAEINLRDFYGLQPFSATYQIKWRQVDNLPFPDDGIGIDDISITLE